MARLQSASRLAGYALLLLSLFAAAAGPNAVQRPLMNPAEAAELRDIKKEITDPDSTFVIAPHGLEWWAGYFLNTPVGSKFPDAGSYQRVLFLRNTIDCPPEVVPPFGLPPIDSSAPKIYFGHYLELYQAN